MDFFKQQLTRIQQQFGMLSVSQKALTACLAALMVLTVMYWGKYAAVPEQVAMMDQVFSPEKGGRIVDELGRQGITATLGTDGRVMVASDKRGAAMGLVAYKRLMPSNYSDAIDKVVGQMTLWDSSAKSEKLWNEKKGLVLAQMVASFPGVAQASVQIDPADKRSLTAPSQPRAAIYIQTDDGIKGTKHMAMAAADAVMGAQSGLTASNIRVIINGTSIPVADAENDLLSMSDDILSKKQAWERSESEKISRMLSYVPNLLVAVTVDLNTKRVESEKYEVDPKNVIQKETESNSTQNESTLPTPTSVEPGAVPNSGTGAVAQQTGSGGGTNQNTEKNAFQNDWGKTRTKMQQPAGNATVTAASVRVPRSHLVKIWKALNPKATTEPDEATLGQVVTAEFDRIRKDVINCTGLKDPSAVSVDYFVDTELEPLAASSGAGGQVLTIVGGYGKEVALGALAVAALLMVSGIVKKGAVGVPAAAVAALIETKQEQERAEMERIANGGEDVAGSASEGVSALEALELDEETSQTQQMINQVANMVKDNPDGAVSLVKRWMNRM